MTMAKKLKQGDICKILEAFDDEIDLAEIPSDTDSIVDEVEVFDEENLQELFDAIVEDDNEDVGIVERKELGFSRAHNSREVYDSDDEVPLADLRRNRELLEPPKWSKQNSMEPLVVFAGEMQGPTDVIESMPSHDPRHLTNQSEQPHVDVRTAARQATKEGLSGCAQVVMCHFASAKQKLVSMSFINNPRTICAMV